jgi:hypothetical protein
VVLVVVRPEKQVVHQLELEVKEMEMLLEEGLRAAIQQMILQQPFRFAKISLKHGSGKIL